MADANKIRQRRHDSCLATARCPRCQARPGRECHEVVFRGNGHIYTRATFNNALRCAGRQMGKTMATTAALVGKFMRSDWGREMRGLHKERWAAWEGRSAVERLGELLDG